MYNADMKTPSLKVPHIKVARTALLVGGAVLLILGLIAYGAVRNVQAKHDAATAARIQNEQAQAKVTAEHEAFSKAQGELNVQTNKANAACLTLKQYAAAPATAKLVKVPPVCNI